MRCPVCRCNNAKIIETRMLEDEQCLRRRRECLDCQTRFTTYERVESNIIAVIKRNGDKQAFNLDKIIRGINRSLEKRPWTSKQIERLIDQSAKQIKEYALEHDGEIESERIGEIVLARLKKLDKVAYIRFASVYKSFEDLASFQEELDKLQ